MEQHRKDDALPDSIAIVADLRYETRVRWIYILVELQNPSRQGKDVFQVGILLPLTSGLHCAPEVNVLIRLTWLVVFEGAGDDFVYAMLLLSISTRSLLIWQHDYTPTLTKAQ
jgi:hypothetical protein